MQPPSRQDPERWTDRCHAAENEDAGSRAIPFGTPVHGVDWFDAKGSFDRRERSVRGSGTDLTVSPRLAHLLQKRHDLPNQLTVPAPSVRKRDDRNIMTARVSVDFTEVGATPCRHVIWIEADL